MTPGGSLKEDFEELLKVALVCGEIDLRKLREQEIDGHDVETGPCSCGAWHERSKG